MRRRRSSGFTMLELLIVLLLVGLVAGMAVPRVDRALDAARQRAFERDLQAVLVALPLQAFRQGQALDFDAAALMKRLPAAPAALRIDLPQPLRYGPDGVAEGGEVWLRTAGAPALHLRVARVTGQVSLDGVPAGNGSPAP